MVCATAHRSGHDNDIARAQQDRNWYDVARETTDEKDCGVSEASHGPKINKSGGNKGKLTIWRQEVKWHKSRSGRHDPSGCLSFGKS
jgi:hypothetical protein